ncbi:MAG: hypothetical protein FWG12_00285 [Holophagaceae bacterium]|nr:hypothetical protein [Holophagaceae bacterium]
MTTLKTLLLAPALLVALCSSLTAQDFKVAVHEPGGASDIRSEELKDERKLAKDQFSSTITGTRGFMLFDRANFEGIMGEHEVVRLSGLFDPNEPRILGAFKGADYVIFSELSRLEDGAIRIRAQAINVETAHVAGSSNKLVSNPTSQLIMYACQDLMNELLKQVTVSTPPTPTGDTLSPLSGLENELNRILINNRTNRKWNTNKANYGLEIDLSGINIDENRQFRTSRVSGRVAFIITDPESGNSSVAELDLVAFTEMGKDLIQRKIREQVQAKVNNIIRDLLEGLDD